MKSSQDDIKRQNGERGSQFEAAIVKILDKQGEVQWTKPIDKSIMEDAKECARAIVSDIGQPTHALQCGQHTSTEVGDISLSFSGGKKFNIEMKYISGSANGTWHNTSADLFINQLPGYGFLTIKELLNSTPMADILGETLEIPITDNLTYVCGPKDSFNSTLKNIFEPFEPFDMLHSGADEVDDFLPNQDANSPFGSTHTSYIENNHDTVILIDDGGTIYTRLMKDDEYKDYYEKYKESIADEDDLDEENGFDDDTDDDDTDDDYNDWYELETGKNWKLNGTSEAIISPAMVYAKVMKFIGRKVMGYLGKSHYTTIMSYPDLPQKVLSLFCDKKESSDKMKDGKRPAFLIVFNRKTQQTGIFDCKNYKAEGNITFNQDTDNKYTISSDSVTFTFQYAWGGGSGIKNPVIRVFLGNK